MPEGPVNITREDRATTFGDLKPGDVFRWGYLWLKTSCSSCYGSVSGRAVKIGDDFAYREVSDDVRVVRCEATLTYSEPHVPGVSG